ncbi:hypothetical protein KY311_05055 [Candidatus Woesearchaeota archaeon]|nr:hypothetical protein [Candidatus Woesearchaeota archaeon]
MKKKAQGISVETMVIVALAVLVLVVVAIFFVQRIGKGESQIDVVTNPITYKAACLSKYQSDTKGYQDCVDKCEKAAKEGTTSPAECKLPEKK